MTLSLFYLDDELLLDVTIPGQPVGAARPVVVRLKNGMSHTFIPKNSVAWAERASLRIECEWTLGILDEPLAIEVLAIFRRPQYLMTPIELRRRPGRVPATCPPDGDNILKLAQDALVQARVVRNDSRIVEGRYVKAYASAIPLEQPGVRIQLYRRDLNQPDRRPLPWI